MTAQLYYKLRRWAAFRHPRKWTKWCYRRYWKRLDDLIRFTDGEHYLFQFEHTKIERHPKVKGHKSPGACPELVEGTAMGPTGRLGWVKTPPSRNGFVF
jgi:hypothetical protein